MDASQISIVGFAFLFAAFAKGVSGLGFSTTALPFLALSIGIKEALPILIIPSLASNVLIMTRTDAFRESVFRFRYMYLGAMIGVAAGVVLLGIVDGQIAGFFLGFVLMIYCAFAALRPNFRLRPDLERPLAPLTGLVTGSINGLTGSQVMPLLPFLLSLRLTPDVLVQSSNVSFTLSSLVMTFGLAQLGLFTLNSLTISIVALVPVWLGLTIGARLRQRLPANAFRMVVLIMLGLSGIALMVRPFF